MADQTKPIVIGSDHNGMELKNLLRDYMISLGYQVVDYGVNEGTPVDYPDVAAPLAEAVAEKKFDRGVLICGTGAGMAIVANKIPGVRAVCVMDPYTAERAIASNNAQIITFGSQVLGPDAAKVLLKIWLDSEFQGGRSAPKVAKIEALDQKYHTKGDH